MIAELLVGLATWLIGSFIVGMAIGHMLRDRSQWPL
jgi:hypothetical protein